MAAGTVYITEYTAPFVDIARGMPMVLGPKIANNNVTSAVGSVQTNAFSATTRVIRVHNDSGGPVGVEVGGTNPTATAGGGATASQRMAASATEYFYVNPGDKLAVIITT